MRKSVLLFLVAFLHFAAQAEARYIKTSDGVDLYVEVKGKGTPCLYLHGGPGAGSHFWEKFSGGMLEQHFQMIYLDQRGVGRSTSPRDSNYSMDRMVKDFEEVRTALGAQHWVTLGHSFGGILQMGYAQRYPQVIDGMIMINCTLCMKESFENSWCPKACEFLNIVDTKLCTDETVPLWDRWNSLIGKLLEKDLMWKMAFGSKRNMEIMNASAGEVPNQNREFEAVAMTMEGFREDFRKSAPDMKMPVLFFYGRQDWMAGSEHHRGVKFPEMMLWGSDVSHMPFLDNNAEMERAIVSYQKKYKL